MWEVIFNASDTKWLIESLSLSIPWLIFAILWTALTYKVKLFRIIGISFVIIGTALNIFTVYFYYLDRSELNNGEYLEIEGIATNISVYPKYSRFTVNGLVFKGGDYNVWVVPKSKIISKIQNNNRVKVLYIPKAEHGTFPAGNKILRIDVYCTQRNCGSRERHTAPKRSITFESLITMITVGVSLLILNLIATHISLTNHFETKNRKILQVLFVWLLPYIGALHAIFVNRKVYFEEKNSNKVGNNLNVSDDNT